MRYENKEIAERLKAARNNKGLSQRALSKLAGLPQSHISKIENGMVDLRLSSLIEMARVLDLEVTLVPRKNIAAVNTIIRGGRPTTSRTQTESAIKEIKRLQKSLSQIAHQNPNLKEVAQVQRRMRELTHFQLPHSSAKKLQDIYKELLSLPKENNNTQTLQNTLKQIQMLRNELVHGAQLPKTVGRIRPAYSLEEDDHD